MWVVCTCWPTDLHKIIFPTKSLSSYHSLHSTMITLNETRGDKAWSCQNLSSSHKSPATHSWRFQQSQKGLNEKLWWIGRRLSFLFFSKPIQIEFPKVSKVFFLGKRKRKNKQKPKRALNGIIRETRDSIHKVFRTCSPELESRSA